jgi:hypothetical protein
MKKHIAKLLVRIASAISPSTYAAPPAAGGSLERRTPGFVSVAANLMRLHPAAFDLQVVYGELEHTSADKVGALWSAAVTMSWQQSKILALFLALHLQVYEKENGCVEICKAVFPDFVPGAAARLPVDKMFQVALGNVAAPSSYPAGIVH